MAVQLKIQRGSTLKIFFLITSHAKSDAGVIVSKPVNINDLVLAEFKFFITAAKPVQLNSATIIKAKTANMPIVPLKITCGKYSEQLYCTDKPSTTQILQLCIDQDKHEILYPGYGYIWIATYIFEVNITILNMMPSTPMTNSLYDDTEFTDFELSTSDGSVPVHKAMLFMHSDMFKLMMRGEWKETSHGRISIDGVTVQTLKQLKDYMYLGSLPDEEEQIETLLVIGAHYFMEKLKSDCIAKLSRSITPENLNHLVELACVHNLPDLVRVILLETPNDILNKGYQLKNNQELGGQKSDK